MGECSPGDADGVGTELVTGSGHPTSGFVYKLVALEDDAGRMVSVAKKSADKISIGGRKHALRRRNAQSVAEAEVIGISPPWHRRKRASLGSSRGQSSGDRLHLWLGEVHGRDACREP